MAQLGTRFLTLEIDGDDVTGEISNCRLVAAEGDSDFVTFLDAAGGGLRKYTLSGTAVQDPSTGSFWDKIWTAAGSDVAFELAPAGGPVGATKPTFTGNVTLSEPDGDILGGEANKSNSARMTWEFAFECTAKPVRAFA